RADDIVERAQALVDGRVRIRMMQLVQIDVIRAQATERGVDRLEDVLARQALVPGTRPHGAEALGRDHEVLPPALEPAAENLLGAPDGLEVAAHRVDVRGVEERDAAGRGAIENGNGGLLVALQAERHGAEAEPRDGKPGAPETDVMHDTPLFTNDAVSD